MNTIARLISLASALKDNALNDEAHDVAATVLDLTEVKDVGVISPGHPMYDRIRTLMRPHDAIHQRLDSFQQRHEIRE